MWEALIDIQVFAISNTASASAIFISSNNSSAGRVHFAFSVCVLLEAHHNTNSPQQPFPSYSISSGAFEIYYYSSMSRSPFPSACSLGLNDALTLIW